MVCKYIFFYLYNVLLNSILTQLFLNISPLRVLQRFRSYAAKINTKNRYFTNISPRCGCFLRGVAPKSL